MLDGVTQPHLSLPDLAAAVGWCGPMGGVPQRGHVPHCVPVWGAHTAQQASLPLASGAESWGMRGWIMVGGVLAPLRVEPVGFGEDGLCIGFSEDQHFRWIHMA